MENYFEIGKITGTHGIRGTMRVFPTTQDPTRFERLKEITVEIRGKQELFHIQKVAYQKNMILLTVGNRMTSMWRSCIKMGGF